MIHRARRREGTVLVAVLVVVVILSLAAYHYSDLMTSEYRASIHAHRSAQVKAIAESGVHYAAALLATPEQVATRLNNNPWHNPDLFDKIRVPGDPDQPPGMFSLIAPADSDDAGSLPYRNGVSDESSKINLNSMMKLDPSGKKLTNLLVKLPNMTEEIAAAIVDWLDADSDTRSGGAENDVYSAMSPSYRCKNGPLDSLDELLLVQGVTRELLFGTDTNRNGLEDPGENTGNGFERGWSAFLTIYSREQNRDASGQAFLYLNDKNLPELYEKLSVQVDEDLAKFLVLYRQYGPANSSGNSQSLGGSIAALLGASGSSKGGGMAKAGDLAQYQPNFGRGASKQLSSIFDLVGAQVGVQKRDGKGFPSTTIYSSPLNDLNRLRDLLPKLFKSGTLVEGTEIPARININTAPREVLLTLPGLTENDVQNILAVRPKLSAAEQPSEVFDTLAWLATDAKLQISQLKKLEQYVTARTQVYRVQSVGSLASGGPTARVEAIIDTNSGRPRFLAWRDLTELGQRKLD